MRLGFGKIRFQFTENICHFVIEDQPSLIRLVALLNGRFRTNHKLNAFNILVTALNTRRGTNFPLLPINSIMNYNWLAGFTDADGSFFVSIASSPRMSIGFQVTANIS